jgi:hypothetical protein
MGSLGISELTWIWRQEILYGRRKFRCPVLSTDRSYRGIMSGFVKIREMLVRVFTAGRFPDCRNDGLFSIPENV